MQTKIQSGPEGSGQPSLLGLSLTSLKPILHKKEPHTDHVYITSYKFPRRRPSGVSAHLTLHIYLCPRSLRLPPTIPCLHAHAGHMCSRLLQQPPHSHVPTAFHIAPNCFRLQMHDLYHASKIKRCQCTFDTVYSKPANGKSFGLVSIHFAFH